MMADSQFSGDGEPSPDDSGDEHKTLLHDLNHHDPPSAERIHPGVDREAREDTSSNFGSIMNLLKGNIGLGLLSMPVALKYAGLWFGMVGIVFISVIAIHTMHTLVNLAHRICEKTQRSSLRYGETVQLSFVHGIPATRRFAPWVRFFVNMFLIITQLGFCCVYIIFCSSTIYAMIDSRFPGGPNLKLYGLVCVFLLLPYVLITKIKYLYPFSLIANIFCFVSLAVALVYGRVKQDVPFLFFISPVALPLTVLDTMRFYSLHRTNVWVCWSRHFTMDIFQWVMTRPGHPQIVSVAPVATWPLFFGIVVFAFEGIGLVLPIENKMERPVDFIGWTGVLNTGMMLVTLMYLTVGFYGYWAYGDKSDNLINMLPHTGDYHSMFIMVRLLMVAAIYMSFGLQFYVPLHDIIWPVLQPLITTWFWQVYGEWVVRIITLFLTALLAIFIPCLNEMISLVGAVSCTSLALLFPSLAEIVFLAEEGRIYFGCCRWRLWKDIFIIIFGLLGFFVGTYVSLLEISNKMKTGQC